MREQGEFHICWKFEYVLFNVVFIQILNAEWQCWFFEIQLIYVLQFIGSMKCDKATFNLIALLFQSTNPKTFAQKSFARFCFENKRN